MRIYTSRLFLFIFLAGLSNDAILSAAQSMEEVFYKKGDTIIEQDDFGDTFFVVEEGLVSIRVIIYFTAVDNIFTTTTCMKRKANMKDKKEEAKELAQLGKNQFFGEIALMVHRRSIIQ